MPPLPPYATGIGLRAPHFDALLRQRPPLDWLEVHSENFFDPRGRDWAYLEAVAEHYSLSFHGIGLSLGSADPLDADQLRRLKRLVDHFHPVRVSDHLSWSSIDGRYFNDLLPLPYTEATLVHFADRVSRVQDHLGRPLLIENPTAYLRFEASTLEEWQFLNALVERSGCQLLLDLNNLHVNACNLGLDPQRYLARLHWPTVAEIHLAGFSRRQLDDGQILIDTHGSPVSAPVWALYRQACRRCDAPVLIEWDTDLPPLAVLLSEAARARRVQTEARRASA